MGRFKGLKNVWPFNMYRRRIRTLNINKKPWKFGSVQAEYAFLIGLEVLLGSFGWWYYVWGSGYRLVFLALTVFLFMVFTKINSDLVAWLNKPSKKKELEKKLAVKKKPPSRFRHHL